jgi:hypothetical protein
MKDQYNLLLGNALILPGHKKTRRSKGWKWFALAAVGAAVTAVGYLGS